jgi:phosphonate transport system ATP-binding protein
MKIHLEQVSLRHPPTLSRSGEVLSAVSLKIASGEKIAIIGPSGAGKTSLLHVLACAARPSEGRLRLNDQDPWSLSNAQLKALRGQLFLAPQIAPLVPRQRVVTSVLAGQLPQLSLAQSMRNLIYPSNIQAVQDALALFDLAEKLFERVDRLSGGERQRVGLARAVISNAQLLLIDEPLSALDPQRGDQALASLCQMAHDRQATLIATLHHVDMALKFFPRIIGLAQGYVQFDLPVAQVTPALLTELYRHQTEVDHAFDAEQTAGSTIARPAFAPVCR